jgi:transcriptional regulator with XRE-family HTH domain
MATPSTQTQRPHGYARYRLDNCRCYTCAYAVSTYSERRHKAIAAGTWRADTGPVRVHLRALMSAGMGYKRIARAAGVPESTVSRILYGRRDHDTPPPATTRYDIAQRLLAVPLDRHPHTPVEATGTVRRAQALVAIGYTLTEIAGHLGWTLQNFSSLIHDGSTPYALRVELRTAQTMTAVYDQLSMTPSTGRYAARARAMAARRGWPPPLAWDDEQLDEPAAKATA